MVNENSVYTLDKLQASQGDTSGNNLPANETWDVDFNPSRESSGENI